MLKEEDKEPIVTPFVFYINAYRELSTCRNSSGTGVTPIPFTAIVEYAKIYSIEDFCEFIYLIREMDNAYLEFNSRKGNDNKQANPSNTDSSPRNRGAKASS